ncbi:hypothetical protein [Burkholderia glumae]|uniref:hypothetical protein n=1 Tax=Burkholderia glumae TaxID=337 RepID=UPI00214FDB3E|nr:hypothetical protein [Burkholderia glumae]
MTDTTHHFKFLGELDAQQIVCELAMSRLAAGPVSVLDVVTEAFLAVAALDKALAVSRQARAQRSGDEAAGARETRQPDAADYSAGFTTPEEEIRRRAGDASVADTPTTQSRST